MIEIDGSSGEGGGQIVRTALALSTLTGKPFHVHSIRKNRPEPGLKAQHLTAINALREICNAKTNDIKLGSQELEYSPGKIKCGTFSFDIGTAGSITLFLQAVLLPLMFAPKKTTISITGGTCGKWQAPVEYFQQILLPQIGKFCNKISCVINKRGYYPRGGGIVTVEISPKINSASFNSLELFLAELEKIVQPAQPFDLNEQGELVLISGISHASKRLALRQVAERQSSAASEILRRYKVPVTIRNEYSETFSVGSGITLAARFNKEGEPQTFLGADALGEQGMRAEDVGKIAAERLALEIDSGATVDVHAADQLLPFAVLVGGVLNASSISEHANTNMRVIEKFLPVTFSVDGSVIAVRR